MKPVKPKLVLLPNGMQLPTDVGEAGVMSMDPGPRWLPWSDTTEAGATGSPTAPASHQRNHGRGGNYRQMIPGERVDTVFQMAFTLVEFVSVC